MSGPEARRGAAGSLRGTAGAAGSGAEEEAPRLRVGRRQAALFALFVLSVIAFLYFVVPQIAGLGHTWRRIEHGRPWWLGFAALLTALSFGGYVVLFRTVFVRGQRRIGWSASYQITMAGLAATRLFAAAGAGGVALTAWALRRSGMGRREVAVRMTAFLALTYVVYCAALVLVGIGLYAHVLPGGGSFAITIVPAILGGGALVLALAATLLPSDIDVRLERWSRGRARAARWVARLGAVPASLADGIRMAFGIARSASPGLLGAIAWWGFNIAVLWATFRAFGGAPQVAVLVMAYFVGMLANVLPLPGGVGGVDGGMIGALIAFGTDDGLAVVAVLAYRAFAFWLPTVPGVLAYIQLRRTVNRWRTSPSSA